MNCRFCSAPLQDVFVDLGAAPPSNAFLELAELGKPEAYFPLRLLTCSRCFLVQVDEVQSHAALFSPDYKYFSSFSHSWLRHAEDYVGKAISRLDLGPSNLVLEVASNDGYLLQFVAARGIPCVGVEPTAGTAAAAKAKGIDTICEFFGLRLAEELVRARRQADLVIANNVLAHVPDLNDFVAGLAAVLAPMGTLTVEFPHLMELVSSRQFDTIYHEHFSYFSLGTVKAIFETHGLLVWDVEKLSTHGGSLRLWVCHRDDGRRPLGSVDSLLGAEAAAGMTEMPFYTGFQPKANNVKNDLLRFLIDQYRAGAKVAAYGAAAKGNTLFNYAGVKSDLVSFVVDASPHKQGRYLPGSRIAVVAESRLRSDTPDFVLILPWNLKEEIAAQLKYIREWGGRFVTAVPQLEIF